MRKSEVTRHRQVTSTAKTITFDNRDHRLWHTRDSIRRRIDGDFIRGAAFGVRTNSGELRDVRAHTKVAASPCKDNRSHGWGATEFTENSSHVAPHRKRHGIAFSRPVQPNHGNRVINRDLDVCQRLSPAGDLDCCPASLACFVPGLFRVAANQFPKPIEELSGKLLRCRINQPRAKLRDLATNLCLDFIVKDSMG